MRKGPELPDQPADQDRLLEPRFMHPAIFIPANVSIGVLYALHDWIYMRQWDGYHNSASLALAEWGMQFLLWGTICWLMWCFMRSAIERANLKQILTLFVPFSLFLSVIEEIVWVFLFPHIPMKHPQWSFLERLGFNLEGDVTQSLPIFWCSFFLFRGVGYYQKFREKESAAAQLEVQLVNAQMAALRMQLNPHFLFNTMNSISSLMRFDIDAADTMLEQLSSLLRITLAKGQAQKIRLQEEMEVVQLYVSIQQLRFGDRVRHNIYVAPEVWDALVPTMVLQPIVENAYVHGIAKSLGGGTITIEADIKGDKLRISICNIGTGTLPFQDAPARQGVGIANVRARLELHYGSRQSFSLREPAPGEVTALFLLPLEIDQSLSHDNGSSLYAASGSDRG